MKGAEEWRRGLWLISLQVFVIFSLYYVSQLQLVGDFLRDMTYYVLGRDFLNFWMEGRAAWTPGPERYYDYRVYAQELALLLNEGYIQLMSYPPTVLLVSAPFGLLPYHVALAVWVGLSVWLLRKATVRVAADKIYSNILLVSPAVLLCLICGQNSMLTAAAVLFVFRWLDKKPTQAGLLLGLLTVKPQLGLLFPILLLVSKRWKVFAVAAAAALSMIGLVVLLYGWAPVMAYLHLGVPTQKLTLTTAAPGIMYSLMSTVFIDLRMLGASLPTAFAVQGCFTLAMAVLVGWTFYKKRDAELSFIIFIAASVLATSYLLAYDLVLMSWGGLLILRRAESRRDHIIATLTFAMPILHVIAGYFEIPGTAFIPLLAIWWSMRQLRS